MLSNWDKVGRFSLDVASAATAFGFSAARKGTKLGFSITRGIASSAAGLTGSVVDHAVFGGNIGAGPVLEDFVSSAISAVESCTLAPISLGESITSTALVAAYSSLSVLQAVYPGSDETSFSLANFVTLLRREWHEDMLDGTAPKDNYGVTELMKALVAWAIVQGKTSAWQEDKWFKYLKEIDVKHKRRGPHKLVKHKPSKVQITRDTPYSKHILTADIGEASSSSVPHADPARSVVELKTTLRRFSQLVLAGYGGASLLFFGVPPVPASSVAGISTKDEETQLAMAVGSSEDQASGSGSRTPTEEPSVRPGSPAYSWWNVLMGKHDGDILLQYAKSQSLGISQKRANGSQISLTPPPMDATMGGNSVLMPRFWILTDHVRQEVVLVLRGTMSLNELAVDLTCDPADFRVRTTEDSIDEEDELDLFDEQLENIPGFFPMDLSTPPVVRKLRRRTISRCSTSSEEEGSFQVHGGILKMARAMGGRGKPVHVAVRQALRRNEGYSLVITGHSLGAGVAALLALMWADPWTCQTYHGSGLPAGRHVSAYCYAPPCLVSARLSRIAALSNLITSFVYSYDLVSRLSLGSVRDLRRAAAWLCDAEKEGQGDGYGGITAKALKAKTGLGKDGDVEWFISIRKTLEANMHMAHLFPPGRVLWAIRDSDLEPERRLYSSSSADHDKLRLFEVQDVRKIFTQIVFAKDMLSSHMPHNYDKALHELL